MHYSQQAAQSTPRPKSPTVPKPLESCTLRYIVSDEIKAHHWTKSIRTLPNVELFVISLSFSRRHIIHDGIPPNIIHGILLLDPEPSFSNNDTNLTFIIRRLRKRTMRKDLFPMSNNGCEPLREYNRMRWLVYLIATVESTGVELFGVLW